MKKTLLIISFLFLSFSFCFADTILLKNGTKIEGTIVEQTDEIVRIDFLNLGTVLKYNKTDIEKIILSEYKVSEEKEESLVSPQVTEPNLPTQPLTSQKPQIITASEYIIYIPSEIDATKRYPLVIAFSPSADANSMIITWKNVSEKQKWIIFASKEFQNKIDMNAFFQKLVSTLKDLFLKLPIDKEKVIVTGFSGGGMASHFFSYLYPDLVKAIVINTGMMHPDFSKKNAKYPKGKKAVFLASSTDFRYKEMERDRKFLENVGWSTKWIEFRGGHTIAPDVTYQEAAEWLKYQFGWIIPETKISSSSFIPKTGKTRDFLKFKDETVRLDIYNPGRSYCPVVILIHGAVGIEGERAQRYAGFATDLMNNGFIAINVYYFDSKRPNWTETFIQTINYAQSISNANKDKIGIVGYSLGGTLALELASKDNRVKAVATSSGYLPENFTKEDTSKLPKILMISGTNDSAINVLNKIKKWRKELGKSFEEKINEGIGHNDVPVKIFNEDWKAIVNFFINNLK